MVLPKGQTADLVCICLRMRFTPFCLLMVITELAVVNKLIIRHKTSAIMLVYLQLVLAGVSVHIKVVSGNGMLQACKLMICLTFKSG